MVTARKPKPRSTAERDALAQRLAVAEAQCAALAVSLRDVLATISDGEWSTEDTKAVRRAAKALLVEVGR